MWVYTIRNITTGALYVGITKSTDPYKRWKNHLATYTKWTRKNYRSKLYAAMQKYGMQHFEFSPLERCANLEELSNREIYYISYLDTIKTGYNIAEGGYNTRALVGKEHKRYITINKPTQKSIASMYIKYKKTIPEICKAHNLQQHLIRRVLKEQGISVKKSGWWLTEKDFLKIEAKYKSGTGSTALSLEYGVSEDKVRQILRDRKVDIRTFKESNNIRNKKTIYQYTKDLKLVAMHDSIISCMKSLDIQTNNGQIAHVLDNKFRSYKGYVWTTDKIS